MSPKGCLSTSFLLLLSLWSLLVGGLIVAGWIGAGLLEFFLRAALADLSGARHVAREVLDMLRAIGFGAMAGLWAVGAAVLLALWIAFRRGAEEAPRRPGMGRVIDIEAVVVARHEARPDPRPDPRPDGRDDGPGRLPPPGPPRP
ncbi:MAG: hypothetical protein ACKOUS_13715 [Alphaproteobacteria bacterium]